MTSRYLDSSRGHCQILSRSCGENSGEGLVSILRHGPEMVDSVSHRPYIHNSGHDRNDESEKVSKAVQRKTILPKFMLNISNFQQFQQISGITA